MDSNNEKAVDKFDYDTKDTIVSESTFDVETTNVDELLYFLRAAGQTGTLVQTWHVNKGGVTRKTLVLTQKTVQRKLLSRDETNIDFVP